MSEKIERIVAIGASNLTRGFHTVVSTARAMWGPQVQILAALGHGRSYGTRSLFMFRSLPGILESGIWHELEALPKVPTRALVTDVGNDILYGFSADKILIWVEESIVRLKQFTKDIILTDLPIFSIRQISEGKFIAFRSILVPSCRLSLDQVLETTVKVNAGLAGMAANHGVRFLSLKPEWYGFDPIHIRPSLWKSAWQEILGCCDTEANEKSSICEGLSLYFLLPERQRLFGLECYTQQSGKALPAGARVWLY